MERQEKGEKEHQFWQKMVSLILLGLEIVIVAVKQVVAMEEAVGESLETTKEPLDLCQVLAPKVSSSSVTLALKGGIYHETRTD